MLLRHGIVLTFNLVSFCNVQFHNVSISHTCIDGDYSSDGSETWALTRALQDKVDAFDNKCLRRILNSHSIHGPRNQRKTPSQFTAPAVSAHPGQTASIFWTRGKDGYIT